MTKLDMPVDAGFYNPNDASINAKLTDKHGLIATIVACAAGRRHAQKLSVRELIIERGTPEILADYDRQMWDIETGVSGARATWAALSSLQQRIMLAMSHSGALRRLSPRRAAFASGAAECRLPTVAALLARSLIEQDGSDRRHVLTPHGEFVLKRGR